MNRRDLVKFAGTPIAMAAMPASLSSMANPANALREGDPAASEIELGNRHFELTLMPGDGLQCRVVHLPSGTLLAEGDYSYSFGKPVFTAVHHDGKDVVLLGNTEAGITIEHRFTVDPASSWIEESIKVTNATPHPYVHPLRCGFVLPVRHDTLKNYVFTAVPLRCDLEWEGPDPGSGNAIDVSRSRAFAARKRYLDFSLNDVLYRRRSYPHWWHEHPEAQLLSAPLAQRPFGENHASEAWVLIDGRMGFLISKYNQVEREYAVLDRTFLANGLTGLRWGGASAPDEMFGCIHLAPGASYEFGTTRLSAFQGDLIRGYYLFRAEMELRGHRTPDKFDPPVHWNELYDNKLCCSGNVDSLDPKNREKFYRLADMKEAAASAQAMGCDALYLDPGWDTPQSSKLWDESRLGKLHDFIVMLKNEYGGLKLSLHTPLSYWTGRGCDVIPGSALVNAAGAETHFACGASKQYVEESAKRLRVLADAGVCFFMFDGVLYRGECWDPQHHHAVPSTLDEHVRAANQLARMIHQTHPQVLIEMHDQGQLFPLQVPVYYGQYVDVAGTHGFDERWGFEYMWNPMEDLLSGNSINLYYYNLAYSLPLYLHIDLKTDNRNALVFWWTASTCRHLGIGGTHADPAVVAAHKQAMKTYQRLKPYFSRGVFYGINEMTHVHSSTDGKSAVMNCFNVDNQPVEREIRFDPTEFGLESQRVYRFLGGSFRKTGGVYTGTVGISVRGHTLIEIV